MNALFDTICIVPVITYTSADSSTIHNVDPRVFFLKQQKHVSNEVARALSEKQTPLFVNWQEIYYATYAYIARRWMMEYCSSKSLENIVRTNPINKWDFLALLRKFSVELWQIMNYELCMNHEKNFRIILEHALRSWLKVYRDVMSTWLPFMINNWILSNTLHMPTQIDALRRNGSPTVRDYFQKKIDSSDETPREVRNLFSQIMQSNNDIDIKCAVSQAWTFAAELYSLRRADIEEHLKNEICWNKN